MFPLQSGTLHIQKGQTSSYGLLRVQDTIIAKAETEVVPGQNGECWSVEGPSEAVEHGEAGFESELLVCSKRVQVQH